MKVMLYILWYARDGRTLPHNILEEMRFRAIEAHQAGKGVAEIAKLLGVHLGQCITLAYKMAARWTEGS